MINNSNRNQSRTFLIIEDGQTLTEYALLLGFVVVVFVVFVMALMNWLDPESERLIDQFLFRVALKLHKHHLFGAFTHF